MDTTTFKTVKILVNKGRANEYEELVRPLRTVKDKTLVAFIKGANVNTRWMTTAHLESVMVKNS